MLLRLCHSMAIPFSTYPRRSPLQSPWPILLFPYHFLLSSVRRRTTVSALPSSNCNQQISSYSDLVDDFPSKQVSEQFSPLLRLLFYILFSCWFFYLFISMFHNIPVYFSFNRRSEITSSPLDTFGFINRFHISVSYGSIFHCWSFISQTECFNLLYVIHLLSLGLLYVYVWGLKLHRLLPMRNHQILFDLSWNARLPPFSFDGITISLKDVMSPILNSLFVFFKRCNSEFVLDFLSFLYKIHRVL